MRTRRRWVVAAAAVALLATSCTGDEKESETFVDLPPQSINAHKRSEMQPGGELRLPVRSAPTSYNPLSTAGSSADTRMMMSSMLPTFFRFDARGTPVPDPDHVVSAEASGSPTVLTLKLNPDAKWGDGTPITWADVAATLTACNGSNPNFDCADTAAFSSVAKVEKGATDFDVKITYTTAGADWARPFEVVGTLRAASVQDPTVFNTGWNSPKPEWLSGPFTLDRRDAKGAYLSVVPNPNWWGQKPLLSRVTFKTIPTDAQAGAYINNEVDSFAVQADPEAINRAKGVADGDIRTAAQPSVRELVINTRAAPLDDPKVRQAILAALDRHEIAESDLKGVDFPGQSLNSHLFVSTQKGYQNMAERTGLGYDVEHSQQLLEEAGWTAGDDGRRTKNGKPLKVSVIAAQGQSSSESEAAQVQRMLKEVGFQVDITPVPADQYASGEVFTNGDFQLGVRTTDRSHYPVQTATSAHGEGEPGNVSGWTSPEATALITEIADTSDPAERATALSKLDELLWTQCPTIPLYQLPEVVAARTQLGNYGAFGLGAVEWEEVGFVR